MARGFWNRLEPGSLNKRVTFCRQTETLDEFGKTTNGLTEVITLWADLYPIRGKERDEVQKAQGEVTHKCYCRWHSKIADLDSTWYLKYRGKKYAVESAIDGGYAKRFFEIYCTEYIGKEEMPDAPKASPEEQLENESDLLEEPLWTE